MKSTLEMLEDLYFEVQSDAGDSEAKKFLSNLVFSVLSDCQDSKNDQIVQALEKEIKELHATFIQKKKVA